MDRISIASFERGRIGENQAKRRIRAEQVGQLDPQSLVVQSVDVLIGSLSSIAGKLPGTLCGSHTMEAMRTCVGRSVAVVALFGVGCGTDTRIESTPDSFQIPNESAIKQADQFPSFASTFRPAGNEQTLEFLKWARERYAAYCTADLDASGDIVQLNIDICWDTQDEELKRISALKRIRSLSLNGPSITDQGLRYLEDLPALKSLRVIGASLLSDDGLNRLKSIKPDLAIDLPYRKAT